MFDFITKARPEVVAAAIAILGVIISAIFSYYISRRSSYLVTVTAERSKWIDKLRENIADLLASCGATYTAFSAEYGPHNREDLAGDDALARYKATDRVIAVITMQLNPNNVIDQNMIRLLALFPKSCQGGEPPYRTLEAAFVRHAQFLLKAEWEKVKYEASGLGWRLFTWRKRRRHKCEYNAFCKRAGLLTGNIPLAPS